LIGSKHSDIHFLQRGAAFIAVPLFYFQMILRHLRKFYTLNAELRRLALELLFCLHLWFSRFGWWVSL